VDLTRALGFAFEDEEWMPKLAIMAGILLASALLMPVLIGFVGIAAALGYMVELVRNVRDAHPRPLPRWDNYGDKITKGANVLMGIIVYQIPNGLISCCLWLFGASVGDSLMGGGMNLALLCCVVPLLLIYNLVTLPMLALGVARYAEEGNVGVFFQFSDLFSTVQRGLSLSAQYILYYIIIGFALSVVALIPCLGWIASAALAIPANGFLIAQYASLADDKPKRKLKPKPGY
jgi:hypothetical protein